jgi:hypothetical protein
MSAPAAIRILGLAVLFHTGLAAAERPGDEAMAQALFEQGRDAMRRGAYSEACPKFLESQRLDPSNGTLLNLVLCHEKLGKVASAWLGAQELVSRLPADDPRKQIAERRVAALSPRVPRLRIELAPTAPADTRLLLNGAEIQVSAAREPTPIDPGLHVLLVRAPGRDDRAIELTIDEGRIYESLVEPGAELRVERPPPAPVASAPAPQRTPNAVPARRSSPPPSRAEPSHPAMWIGWTATGVGVAALTASGVLLDRVLDRKAAVEENCPNKLCRDSSGIDAAEEGKQLQVAAVATLVVGAAGVSFGVYALTRPDDGARVGSRASIVATPSSAYVGYASSF